TVGLRGSDLKRFAGKRATVNGEVKQGEPLAQGVSRIITVATIDVSKASVKTTSACRLPPGTAGSGKAAGGAAPAAGAGGGHTVAILGVAGLAAGGAVGGLYAAGVVGEQPASRQ